MDVEAELIPDDLDPTEEAYLVRYKGEWLGHVVRRATGWEARTVTGFKGPIYYSSTDRAVMSLILKKEIG